METKATISKPLRKRMLKFLTAVFAMDILLIMVYCAVGAFVYLKSETMNPLDYKIVVGTDAAVITSMFIVLFVLKLKSLVCLGLEFLVLVGAIVGKVYLHV